MTFVAVMIVFCVGMAVGSVLTVSILGQEPDDTHRLRNENARLFNEVTDIQIAVNRRDMVIIALKKRERQLGEEDPGDWWKKEKPNPLGECS